MNSQTASGSTEADEARIRWLIERYYFAIDSKDDKLMRSCFTEDAKVVYHMGESREVRLVDREAVMSYLLAGTAWNGPSIHALSSTVVNIGDGDGEAQASSFAIAHLVVQGKIHVRGLRYDDRMVRRGEDWEIASREHRAIWQFDAESAPSMVLPRT